MPTLLRRLACAGAVLAFALGVAPAQAQPETIEIAADKDWQHQWTPMTFPARIDKFEREFIAAYEERETNISARYFDERSQTILSLYIYRPGNPSTAIWFDRALMAVGAGGTLGTVETEDEKIARFVPSGGTVASGLSAVLAASGGRYRSTGVALYRAGEWLVKVRITSAEQSVTQLSATLRKVLGDLPALEGVDTGAAQFVTPCDTPLVFGDSEPVPPTTGLAMSMVLMSDVVAALTEVKGEGPSPDSYCREGDRNIQYNVYRPVGDNDRYSLVLGDSGASIEVFPFLALDNPERSDADNPTHLVSSSTGLETSFHTPFRGIPNIGPASRSAFEGPVYAKMNRRLSPDENPQITIASGLAEDAAPE